MISRFIFTRSFRNPRIYINKNVGKAFSSISQENNSESNEERKLSGFAKAFKKHGDLDSIDVSTVKEQSFATMFRNSKFIDLGDPENRIVSGTIFHVVDDDLYIDFGWKFHCVCSRPNKNSSAYVRGAKVKLRIKDLELSSKFLGHEKDLTLLEADAHLIGLISTPVKY